MSHIQQWTLAVVSTSPLGSVRCACESANILSRPLSTVATVHLGAISEELFTLLCVVYVACGLLSLLVIGA